MQSPLTAGTVVRVRGGLWLVESVTPYELCMAIRLAGVEHANHGWRRTVLHPFDRPRALARSDKPRVVPRQRVAVAAVALLEAATPWDSLRCLPAADIALMPHQLEPVLTILRTGAPRVLIADEVGLGKTIQAGLIVAELQARLLASHTLVVTPAGLREQWADELARRFGLACDVIDAPGLRRDRTVAPGANPWTVSPIAITSIDFVKQPEVLNGLEAIAWDVLLVDEAHGASPGSDRARAVATLARKSRHVVLLTATPHAGDNDAFEHLCSIGQLGTDPIAVFRRTRSAAGLAERRRVRTISVSPCDEEARMLRLVSEYGRLVSSEPRPDARDVRLVAAVLKKRAISSPAALERSLARRLQAAQAGRSALAQLLLPLADPDESPDDLEPAHLAGVPGLQDLDADTAWLTLMIGAARAVTTDYAKLRVLLRLLRRSREPAIVFTEYRDTLLHIHGHAAASASTAVLHGGLTRAERRTAESLFRSGEARVLLATDAAGEGLNLHARCRTVINFELPWNPMRLEQRIGRVDRIGQTGAVRVINIVARGTAEASVLLRLFEKLDRVGRSIGSFGDVLGSLSEPLLRDLVLQEDAERLHPLLEGLERVRPGPPPSGCWIAAPLSNSRDCEVSRAQAIRGLLETTGRRTHASTPVRTEIVGSLARRGPWIAERTRNRRGGMLDGVLLIATVRISDDAHKLIEMVMVPLLLEGRLPRPDRAVVDTYVALMARHRDDLEQEVARAAAERAALLRGPLEAYCAAGIARLDRMAAAVRRERTAARAQPGLFDRRVERAVHSEDERTNALLAALDHVRKTLINARTIRTSSPRFDLALVCRSNPSPPVR